MTSLEISILNKLLSYSNIIIKGSGHGNISTIESDDFIWNCSAYPTSEAIQEGLIALIEFNAKKQAIDSIKKEMWGPKK